MRLSGEKMRQRLSQVIAEAENDKGQSTRRESSGNNRYEQSTYSGFKDRGY